MPLNEWMKTITHREYLTRLQWLDEQWNQPSRTDNYLMVIAAEVRRVLAKNPRKIKPEDFRLQWGEDKKPKSPGAKQAKADQAKMGWIGSLGKVITRVLRRGDQDSGNADNA